LDKKSEPKSAGKDGQVPERSQLREHRNGNDGNSDVEHHYATLEDFVPTEVDFRGGFALFRLRLEFI
jgi:hypothetical protein